MKRYKRVLFVLPMFCAACLAGCAGVMHVTNNFPPGRNEAGVFNRSTNDIGVYSDTGDSGKQEASSMMVGIKVTKPGEGEPAMPDQPSPPPDVSGKEPPSAPGATAKTPK